MKYTLEFKLKCVERYKRSHSYVYPPGIKSKGTFRFHVLNWVRLYDDLGVDGLRRPVLFTIRVPKAKNTGQIANSQDVFHPPFIVKGNVSDGNVFVHQLEDHLG